MRRQKLNISPDSERKISMTNNWWKLGGGEGGLNDCMENVTKMMFLLTFYKVSKVIFYYGIGRKINLKDNANFQNRMINFGKALFKIKSWFESNTRQTHKY